MMKHWILLAALSLATTASGAGAAVTLDLSSDAGTNTNIVSSPTGTTTVPIDVYVTSDGTDYLAAYDIALTSSPTSATFGATLADPINHPTLFDTNLANYGNASTVEASASLNSGQDQITGDAGLFSFDLILPANATGAYTVNFNPDNTFLFDGSGNSLTIAGLNGLTLNVTPPAPAPEPTGLAALFGGLLLLSRRRNRRSPAGVRGAIA